MLKNKKIQISMIVALTILVAIRLFYKLGAAGLNATDEAWYAVNTCEMFQTGNWIVPTLRHEIDYGSKPPLSFLLNLISYSIFGISAFSLRLSSAIAGFITFGLIVFYLYKRHGASTAIIGAAVFQTLRLCFDFHMFRAGDMDALFCMFGVICIYALHEIGQGRAKMTIVYGIALGLAFLTRSMHAGVFFIIGLLYLPVIYKKMKLKDTIIAIICALIPTIIWICARYPYDGFEYFYQITFAEVSDQTDTMFSLKYLGTLIREKIFWLLAAVLIIKLILYFKSRGKMKAQENLKNAGASENLQEDVAKQHTILDDLKVFVSKRYLSILCFCVPMLFYTLAVGGYMEWYVYFSYVSLVWIIAIEAGDLIAQIDQKTWQQIFAYGLVLVCVVYSLAQLREYRLLGEGGRSVEQFNTDISDFYVQTESKYENYPIYIANERHRQYGDIGHWENDFTFYAEANAKLYCQEGGVEGFLADENSLLVIDGQLWDRYADQLTGFVFLEQNTYYVISHERY